MLTGIVVRGGAMALLPPTMIHISSRTGAVREVLARPLEDIVLEVAIRSDATDPIILDVFENGDLRIHDDHYAGRHSSPTDEEPNETASTQLKPLALAAPRLGNDRVELVLVYSLTVG